MSTLMSGCYCACSGDEPVAHGGNVGDSQGHSSGLQSWVWRGEQDAWDLEVFLVTDPASPPSSKGDGSED